ncbi:MAG: hypothetical protein AAGI08_00185 [Bacteroidota bacterium]
MNETLTITLTHPTEAQVRRARRLEEDNRISQRVRELYDNARASGHSQQWAYYLVGRHVNLSPTRVRDILSGR